MALNDYFNTESSSSGDISKNNASQSSGSGVNAYFNLSIKAPAEDTSQPEKITTQPVDEGVKIAPPTAEQNKKILDTLPKETISAPHNPSPTGEEISAPTGNETPASGFQNFLAGLHVGKVGLPNALVNNPVTRTIGGALDNAVNKTTDFLSTLDSEPNGASGHITDYVGKDYSKPTGETIGMTSDQRKSFYDQKTKDSTPLNRVAKGTEAVAAFGQLLFSPISAAFSEAETIPVIKYPAKAIDWGFGKIDQALRYGSDHVVDHLPISQESKDTIRPAVSDVVSLVGQIMAGKVIAEKGIPIVKDKIADIKTTLTKDIIETHAPAKTVTIEPEKIKDIFQTGKLMSAEEKDLVQTLGLSADQYKQGFKTGIAVDVPAQTITELSDKPYWAKIKSVFGIEPTNEKSVAGEKARLAGEAPAPEQGISGLLTAPGAEPLTSNIAETHANETASLGSKNSAEIRDTLAKYQELVNNTDGQARTEAIAKENAARDKFNEFTTLNKETVLEVPSKNALPLAQIDVVRFDDGKWGVSVNGNTSTSGIGFGFGTKVYDTHNLAVEAGRKSLTQWLAGEKNNADIKKVKSEIDKQLGSLSEARPQIHEGLDLGSNANGWSKADVAKEIASREASTGNEYTFTAIKHGKDTFAIRTEKTATKPKEAVKKIEVKKEKVTAKKAVEAPRKILNTTKTGTLKVRYDSIKEKPAEIIPTGHGTIAGHEVFSGPGKYGKETIIYDRRTGLKVGESKYKNGAKAIEDASKTLLEKAGSEEKLKQAFDRAYEDKTKNQINSLLSDALEEKKQVAPTGENASSGGKKMGEFEKPQGKGTAEDFKLFEETKKLVRKYAPSAFGEGYLNRGTLGTFHPDTGNIRTHGINSFSVNVHEISHAIDEQNGITNKLLVVEKLSASGKPIYTKAENGIRTELTKMYLDHYPTARITKSLRVRMREGFATLVQKYVESPNMITNQYPELVKEFLQPGGEFYSPMIGDFIKDSQKVVENYSNLSDLDKVGARVTSDSNPEGKESFFNLRDKFRAFTVDNIYPIEKLAIKSGIADTAKDPSLWARQYNASNGFIINNLRGDRGFWTLEGNEYKKVNDQNWGDLMKMVEKKGMLDQFGNYLVARDQHFGFEHMDDLKEQYVNKMKEVQELKADYEAELESAGEAQASDSKKDYRESLAEAKDLKEQYQKIADVLEKNQFTREEVTGAYEGNKERFMEEEKLFDELEKENLKFLNNPEIGLLDKEQFSNLTGKKGYAPLKREMYNEIIGEETPVGGNKKKFGTKKASSLLERTGSSRTIINPLLSAMKDHAEVVRKGMKQMVYNKVAKMALTNQFPDLFEKVQLKAVPDPQTGAIHFPQEKDPNIIMARIGYKRVPVLTDGYIKKTLEDVLNHENVSDFEKLIIGANRFFTKGTTGLFPGFALTNIVVDQISATAQTQTNYVPLYSALSELAKTRFDKNGPEAKYLEEYMVLGGERQTFVGWQDMTAREVAEKIAQERTGILKVIDVANKGADLLAIPSKYSEIMTRATEYIRSRKQGDNQIVALEKAGRVTAPFHHVGQLGGRFGKTFVKSIPFFSPALQVMDQAIRSAHNPKTAKRMLFVYMAVTAALITSQLNTMKRGSDQQKQEYNDLSAQEKSMYLFFPSHDGKTLVRLRIPQEFTTLGAITNQIIADKLYHAKNTPFDYAQGATAFLPQQFDITDPKRLPFQWIPQILKPAVMTAGGIKDFPTVLPLENQSLSNLPPGLRYTPFTSPVAKWLGKEFNISPIKIDYLLSGYAGRASGFLTGKPGIYNPLSTLTQKPYFQGGRTMQKFYDKKTANDEAFTAMNKKIGTLKVGERTQILRERAKISAVETLVKEYGKVDEKKNPARSEMLQKMIASKIDTL